MKRFLSFILSLIMLLSLVPAAAFAEAGDPPAQEQAEEIPELIPEPVEIEEEDVPFTLEPPFSVPEAESIPDVPVSPLDSVMESMLSAQMEVIRAVYIINGTPEEMKQVEMVLNSLGVEWERRG